MYLTVAGPYSPNVHQCTHTRSREGQDDAAVMLRQFVLVSIIWRAGESGQELVSVQQLPGIVLLPTDYPCTVHTRTLQRHAAGFKPQTESWEPSTWMVR
jgi:hypothetical protein